MGSRGLGVGIMGGATAVVLDRHPLWRAAVERSLEHAGLVVVGTAARPAEALRLLAELRPDLFLAEIDSDDDADETLTAIGRARQLAPGLAVIVVSTAARYDRLRDAVDAGVLTSAAVAFVTPADSVGETLAYGLAAGSASPLSWLVRAGQSWCRAVPRSAATEGLVA